MDTATSKRSRLTRVNTGQKDLGIDTFVFWPSGGDEEGQLRLFAERVVPEVRASIAEKTMKTPAT